jgi:hypothetical protein
MATDPCAQVDQCAIFIGPTPADLLARMSIETALAVFLLVWCIRSRRDGVWAVTGSVAAFCWAAVAALNLAANWSSSEGALGLYSWVAAHAGALDWLRVTGLAVVVLAVSIGRTRARRTVDS